MGNPFWLRVSTILFVFSSDVARNCRNVSLFLFSRSVLVSPLGLLSLLLIPRIWDWRFDVILVESLYSFSAVSAKIFKPKPPRRVGNESCTLSALLMLWPPMIAGINLCFTTWSIFLSWFSILGIVRRRYVSYVGN